MNRKRTIPNSFPFLAVILSTIEIDLSKKKNVLFNAPDKRTPLMTKCEMYNNYNTGTLWFGLE